MKRLLVLKAKGTALFGIALLLGGLVLVLYLVGLFGWQYMTRLDGGPWVPLPASLALMDHSLLQEQKVAPILPFLPELPWPWLMNTEPGLPVRDAVMSLLNKLHIGLVVAVPGLVFMAGGVRLIMRQKEVLRAVKIDREERQRRARFYRDAGNESDAYAARREPFIGPSIDALRDADPLVEDRTAVRHAIRR